VATFASEKCFGLVNMSRALEENKAVGESVKSLFIIIPTIHGTSFCCVIVGTTYLQEVHCKAVSEGLFKMARRFKVYSCNTVLDMTRYITIL
jgi:hypothetical protein